MANKEWLESLKVGDEVAYYTGNYSAPSLQRISRITKTQVVITQKNYNGEPYDVKFNKNTGYKIGASSWNISQIQPVTDGVLNTIKQDKNRRAIKHYAELLTKYSNSLSLDESDNLCNALQAVLNEPILQKEKLAKEKLAKEKELAKVSGNTADT